MCRSFHLTFMGCLEKAGFPPRNNLSKISFNEKKKIRINLKINILPFQDPPRGEVEEIADEIVTKKETYEEFLNAGNGILDVEHDMKMNHLEEDIDDVACRWDFLCEKIETCLHRSNFLGKLPILLVCDR